MPTGFRFLDDSQRQLVAKEVVDQALKRQRVEDLVGRYTLLRGIGVELDDRTKIEIRDNVSLLTKRDLAIEGSPKNTESSTSSQLMAWTHDPPLKKYNLCLRLRYLKP